MLDDWHRRLLVSDCMCGLVSADGSNRTLKHAEALLDALYVIVVPTAGLAAFQQALQHSILVRREK